MLTLELLLMLMKLVVLLKLLEDLELLLSKLNQLLLLLILPLQSLYLLLSLGQLNQQKLDGLSPPPRCALGPCPPRAESIHRKLREAILETGLRFTELFGGTP